MTTATHRDADRLNLFRYVSRERITLACLMCLCVAGPAGAGPGPTDRLDSLRLASGTIESLVQRVSKSVVQIIATGYRPVPVDSQHADVAVGRGRTIGSGVVVDSKGLILTNAHVVEGADGVDVILPTEDGGATRLGTTMRRVKAKIVGVAEDLDLALLSIDVTGLPALPLADYSKVRQGELVFAFGSPDGLRNSVTMGMVSAVARQTDPDDPVVYIQTDAPINPGNSGGPLVDVDGELVGINTFIRTASGGSEGLGFALPSALVSLAYPQLRDYGHLHRAVIGMTLQTVTPIMADGLGLPGGSGLIAADVVPDSPAAAAGFQIGDVVTSIDGQRVEGMTLPRLYPLLYSLQDGQEVAIEARRGDTTVKATVRAAGIPHVCERRPSEIRPTLVEPLGILGLQIDDDLASKLDGLRLASGVIVAMRVGSTEMPDGMLEKGDVIHAVNGIPVSTPEGLRTALSRVAAHGAVVLQIERAGQFSYVAFERDTQ
jgi:serine protease Do